MLKKLDAQTDKETLNAKDKLSVSFNILAKYLVVIFSVLGWNIIILFSAPTLGRPIISGYVLLFILIGYFKEIKVILFMGAVVFLSYFFLFFTYPQWEIFRPSLDITIFFLSAVIVILVVYNINKNYNPLRERNKIEGTKSPLEPIVDAQNEKLQEPSIILEKKVRERTETLEATRKALINLLEDAEESKKLIELEKNKTRAALISLSDGLISFDKKNKIILVNPKAEEILGIKEKDVLEKKIDQILNLTNIEKLYKALGQKIELTEQKYELILGQASKRFFQVSITPILVDKEQIGFMIVLHDVTREKVIDSLKSEFVSIAAHQLRTPLTAIKWTIKTALSGEVGKLNSEQHSLLLKGYESNERVILLVNDLLNVSRIEEGKFGYKFKSYDFAEILDSTIENMQQFVEKNHIELILDKPKKIPKVYADEERLSMALQNLLDNALKYTPEFGKIKISVKQENKFLRVTIKDNGIGIPKKDQFKIFSKFFRASNAIRTETKGSGLGLFIVKNIIDKHHGEIILKSEEGKGTEVSFIIPIKKID